MESMPTPPKAPAAPQGQGQGSPDASGENGQQREYWRNQRDTWRCPDPGCKKLNNKGDPACQQCTLPRHSAHQFKRGGRGGSGGRDNGNFRSGGRGGYGRQQQQQGPMQRYESHRRNNRPQQRRLPDNVDPNHPVVVQFKMFADLIDDKNDRHERIVKLSRDITADSKKVIFLLHRINREDQKPSILQEAEQKLFDIRQRLFKSVARELKGQDAYKYRRAYTAGMQEYIEARSFYHFICYDTLVSYEEIEKELQFKVWNKKKPMTENTVVRKAFLIRDDENIDDSEEDEEASKKEKKKTSEEGDKTSEEASNDSEKNTPETSEEATNASEKTPDASEKETPDVSEKKETPDTSEDNKAVADPTAETEPEKSGGDKDNNTVGDDKDQEDSEVVHSPEEFHIQKKDEDKEGSSPEKEGSSPEKDDYELVQMPVPFEDYVLGIADLTGEVMRQAINATGRSDWDTVFTLLGFLHEINNGFLEALAATPSGYGSGKEIFHKIKTLKASLRKVEQACFTITVRGSELPKSSLSSDIFGGNEEQFGGGSEDWDSSVCSY